MPTYPLEPPFSKSVHVRIRNFFGCGSRRHRPALVSARGPFGERAEIVWRSFGECSEIGDVYHSCYVRPPILLLRLRSLLCVSAHTVSQIDPFAGIK